MADNNILGVLDVKVLADTQAAAESLTTLLASVKESIDGFTRLSSEAKDVTKSVGNSFKEIPAIITESFAPLQTFKGAMDKLVRDVNTSTTNLKEPLNNIKINKGTISSVGDLATAVGRLRDASVGGSLGTVASGIKKIGENMTAMTKSETDLKKFRGTATSVTQAFSKLLGLAAELQRNNEGLLKFSNLTIHEADFRPFINSLEEARRAAERKLDDIRSEFLAVGTIPINFRLGKVEVPKQGNEQIQAYAQSVQVALNEFFNKKENKVELPGIGYGRFNESLKTAVEQVERNFKPFQKDIQAILGVKIQADPFTEYANKMTESIAKVKLSVADLKAIFDGLKAVQETRINITLPGSDFFKDRLLGMKKAMQEAVVENLKGINVNLEDIISDTSVGTQAGHFDRLSRNVSGIAQKLSAIAAEEWALSAAMSTKNVALREQVGLFESLAAASGLESFFSSLKSKAGQPVKLIDIAGIAESISSLAASFNQITSFSNAIAESQFRVGEAATNVLMLLEKEKGMLSQLATMARDAAKAVEFKQTTTPKFIDEAQITTAVAKVRAFSASVETAQKVLANFGTKSGPSLLTDNLDKAQTKAKSLKAFLDALKPDSSIANMMKAELGPSVNPKTLTSWNALLEKVNEYTSFLIRANKAETTENPAVANQIKLFQVGEQIIKSMTKGLDDQDKVYANINGRIKNIVSDHEQLLRGELEEFKTEADVLTALKKREELTRQIAEAAALINMKMSVSQDQGEIQTFQEMLRILNQFKEGSEAAISSINAFTRDIKVSEESLSNYSTRLKGIKEQLATLPAVDSLNNGAEFSNVLRLMNRLQAEATTLANSFNDLSKSSVLPSSSASTVQVMVAEMAALTTEVSANVDAYTKAAEKKKAFTDAEAQEISANKSVVASMESVSKTIKDLIANTDKLSSGKITAKSGLEFLPQSLVTTKNSVEKEVNAIKDVISNGANQIAILYKKLTGNNATFTGFGDIKNAFQNLDIRKADDDLKAVKAAIDAVVRSEEALAEASKLTLLPSIGGWSAQVSSTASSIKGLESNLSKMVQTLTQLSAEGTNVNLFNKLNASAKQSEVSISAAISTVVSSFNYLKQMASGTADESLHIRLNGTEVLNTLSVLTKSFEDFRSLFSSFGINVSGIETLINQLKILTDETVSETTRANALKVVLSELGGVTKTLADGMKKVNETTMFRGMQTSMKELPGQLKNLSSELTRIGEVAATLNNAHIFNAKQATNFELKFSNLQIKEVLKDLATAEKEVTRLQEYFTNIRLNSEAFTQFEKLLKIDKEFVASLEKEYNIKLNANNAEESIKTILKSLDEMQVRMQSQRIGLGNTSEMNSEILKSTSVFSKAIEQLVGLRATMRAVTEEGSLLSKMISNYFTNLAKDLGVSKNAIKDLEMGLTELEDQFVRLRSGVVTWSMGIMMMGQAMLAPFAKAVKDFSSFSDAMGVVQGVTEASNESMKELVHTTLNLTAFSRFSPVEATKGLEELSRAGFSAKDAIGALPTVLRLAQGAAIGVGEAATTVTHMMNTYGLSVKETSVASDVLVKAANESTASVSDIGHAFTYVGALSKGFGVSLQETVGTIGVLSNAGLQGTMAGTALRGMLEHLFNPTKEEAKLMSDLGDRIGGAGLQIKNANGDFIGFAEVLRQLEKAGIKSDEVLALFGQRAGPGVAALLRQGSGALDEFIGRLDTAGGTTAAMADVMQNTLQGKFELFTRSIQSLMHTISSNLEGPLKLLLDVGTSVVQTFANIHSALGPVAKVLDVVAASIAAAMAALGSMTFAWFLVIVPVAQFVGAMNIFMKTLAAGIVLLHAEAAATGISAASTFAHAAALNVLGSSAARATVVMNGLTSATKTLGTTQTVIAAGQVMTGEAALAVGASKSAAAGVSVLREKVNSFGSALLLLGSTIMTGIAKTIAGFGTGLAVLVGRLAMATASLGVLSEAFMALSLSMMANPYIAAIIALAALGTAVYGLYRYFTQVERAKETALNMDKQSESMVKYANDIKDAEKALKNWIEASKRGASNIDLDIKGDTISKEKIDKIKSIFEKTGNKDVTFTYKMNGIKLEGIDVAFAGLKETTRLKLMENGIIDPLAMEKFVSKSRQEIEKTSIETLVQAIDAKALILADALNKNKNRWLKKAEFSAQDSQEVLANTEVMVSAFRQSLESLSYITKDAQLDDAISERLKLWIDRLVAQGKIGQTEINQLTEKFEKEIKDFKKSLSDTGDIKSVIAVSLELQTNTAKLEESFKELEKSAGEVSKKIESDYKKAFDSIDKQLDANARKDAEINKTKLDLLSRTTKATIAAEKLKADETGTYEAFVTDRIIEQNQRRETIITESLRKEESIRKALAETSVTGTGSAGLAEAQIDSYNKFIATLKKSEDVYKESMDQMISQSENLATAINSLEAKAVSFNKSLDKFSTAISKDPFDMGGFDSIEQAKVEATKKSAEARTEAEAGHYAKAMSLAEEAADLLKAKQSDIAKSGDSGLVTSVKQQVDEIRSIWNSAKDGATQMLVEAQRKLQEEIAKTGQIIQETSDKMVAAIEKLISLFEKLAVKSGGFADIANGTVSIQKGLLDDKKALEELNAVIEKRDELVKNAAPIKSATENMAAIDYYNNLEKAVAEANLAQSNFASAFNDVLDSSWDSGNAQKQLELTSRLAEDQVKDLQKLEDALSLILPEVKNEKQKASLTKALDDVKTYKELMQGQLDTFTEMKGLDLVLNKEDIAAKAKEASKHFTDILSVIPIKVDIELGKGLKEGQTNVVKDAAKDLDLEALKKVKKDLEDMYKNLGRTSGNDEFKKNIRTTTMAIEEQIRVIDRVRKSTELLDYGRASETAMALQPALDAVEAKNRAIAESAKNVPKSMVELKTKTDEAKTSTEQQGDAAKKSGEQVAAGAKAIEDSAKGAAAGVEGIAAAATNVGNEMAKQAPIVETVKNTLAKPVPLDFKTESLNNVKDKLGNVIAVYDALGMKVKEIDSAKFATAQSREFEQTNKAVRVLTDGVSKYSDGLKLAGDLQKSMVTYTKVEPSARQAFSIDTTKLKEAMVDTRAFDNALQALTRYDKLNIGVISNFSEAEKQLQDVSNAVADLDKVQTALAADFSSGAIDIKEFTKVNEVIDIMKGKLQESFDYTKNRAISLSVTTDGIEQGSQRLKDMNELILKTQTDLLNKPIVVAPKVEIPKVEVPKAEIPPVVITPKIEMPKVEIPKAEVPPVVITPTVEIPKVELPPIEPPVIQPVSPDSLVQALQPVAEKFKEFTGLMKAEPFIPKVDTAPALQSFLNFTTTLNKNILDVPKFPKLVDATTLSGFAKMSEDVKFAEGVLKEFTGISIQGIQEQGNSWRNLEKELFKVDAAYYDVLKVHSMLDALKISGGLKDGEYEKLTAYNELLKNGIVKSLAEIDVKTGEVFKIPDSMFQDTFQSFDYSMEHTSKQVDKLVAKLAQPADFNFLPDSNITGGIEKLKELTLAVEKTAGTIKIEPQVDINPNLQKFLEFASTIKQQVDTIPKVPPLVDATTLDGFTKLSSNATFAKNVLMGFTGISIGEIADVSDLDSLKNQLGLIDNAMRNLRVSQATLESGKITGVVSPEAYSKLSAYNDLVKNGLSQSLDAVKVKAIEFLGKASTVPDSGIKDYQQNLMDVGNQLVELTNKINTPVNAEIIPKAAIDRGMSNLEELTEVVTNVASTIKIEPTVDVNKASEELKQLPDQVNADDKFKINLPVGTIGLPGTRDELDQLKTKVTEVSQAFTDVSEKGIKINADTAPAEQKLSALKESWVTQAVDGFNMPVSFPGSEEIMTKLSTINTKLQATKENGIFITDNASPELEKVAQKLSELTAANAKIPIEVQDKATSVLDRIKSAINDIRGKVVDIVTRYTSSGAPGHHFGGVIEPMQVAHFATGGDVFTKPNYSVVPGAGDGDKVPAMLEAGEFIMRKTAVNKFGINFMDALNNGVLQFKQSGGVISGIRSSVTSSLNYDPRAIAHYSSGGYVQTSKPASNDSHDVVEVHLKVGDNPNPFSMKSDRDTAHELLKVLKNVR